MSDDELSIITQAIHPMNLASLSYAVVACCNLGQVSFIFDYVTGMEFEEYVLNIILVWHTYLYNLFSIAPTFVINIWYRFG